MHQRLHGTAEGPRKGRSNVTASILKYEDGAIGLVTTLSLTTVKNGDGGTTHDRQVLRLMPNGDIAFNATSDNPIVSKFMPRKNGCGNNLELYKMFDSLYEGLSHRDKTLGLGLVLEEKSVKELVKASDEIRMRGARIGIQFDVPRLSR